MSLAGSIGSQLKIIPKIRLADIAKAFEKYGFCDHLGLIFGMNLACSIGSQLQFIPEIRPDDIANTLEKYVV